MGPLTTAPALLLLTEGVFKQLASALVTTDQITIGGVRQVLPRWGGRGRSLLPPDTSVVNVPILLIIH